MRDPGNEVVGQIRRTKYEKWGTWEMGNRVGATDNRKKIIKWEEPVISNSSLPFFISHGIYLLNR